MQKTENAYAEIRVGHQQRNLCAVVLGGPHWMSRPLLDALTAIFERHAVCIRGLKSGHVIESNPTNVKKALAFSDFDIVVPELSNCEVNQTLELWIDEAEKANRAAPGTNKADIPMGLSVLFYELNATHTAAVRVWHLNEVFPTDTGLMSAHLDLTYGGKRGDLADESQSHIQPGFIFDVKGSTYNSATSRQLVEEIIKKGPPSTQGYAQPILPGECYVFTPDEHDPDVQSTIAAIKEEVHNRGVNLVILDQASYDLLKSDEKIDWTALMKGCVKGAPTWDEIADPGVPHEFPTTIEREQQAEDLRFRERCLGEAAGSLQSQYWNYMHELSVEATTSNTGVAWHQGGRVIKMPNNAIELLHKKLDELGISSADELRAQNWQPTHFPKLNDQLADSLQFAEDHVQDQGRRMIERIQVPPQLRAVENARSDSPLPYGTAYQSEPGNEAPPGWKAPSIDSPEPSSQTDTDSSQSSD